ncbi:MAG: (Fe-S)-binding protein [Chloroflexi bacterium]|nr:(Fe-S)-binding protein [Chloroflexota bacterium]
MGRVHNIAIPANTTTTAERARIAVEVLDACLSPQLMASLEICVRCAICDRSCHFFVANPEPRYIPSYRAEQLRRFYRRLHDPLGRIAPGFIGARDLDERGLQDLRSLAFGTCTMCRRCTLNCPLGVDVALIVRTARAMLARIGMVPHDLQEPIDTHLRVGNSGDIGTESFIESIEWWEEQLQSDVGDSKAKIPLDKQGARILFVFTPRELKSYPLTAIAMAKIFYAAGEDWTVSTKTWDATNFAMFSGDDNVMRAIAQRMRDEAVRLGVREVIWNECGHGYRGFRWEAENWLNKRFPFRVRSFLELIVDYIKEGRLKFDRSRNPQSVTYHDPCNMARNGGLIEEPRYILKNVVADFKEMEPHGTENYCCGGGGGLLFMSEFTQLRMMAAKPKADQIHATGAEIVTSACHNCLDQLTEINSKYRLGVRVKGLSELVAEAIVLP